MVVDEKLLIGNIKGKGRAWLSQPNRILAKGRPGSSDISWEVVENKYNSGHQF